MDKKKVRFHYIKSSAFRSIHVDGAIGGPKGGGMLHMAVFCERPAIPREVEYEIGENGRLVNELIIDARQGFARELEADLVMSLQTARIIHAWLGERIELLEAIARKNATASDSSAGDGAKSNG